MPCGCFSEQPTLSPLGPSFFCSYRPAGTGPVHWRRKRCNGRASPSETVTTTLNQLFETALQSEPNYRAAQDTLTAAQARERQAFGALLPQISATGNNNTNRRSYYQRDSNGTTLRDGYGSNGYQFSITQPLWRPASISSLNQAEKASEQTLFQLADSEQQLYIKLATAWFDLMEAHDGVEFSTAQRDALKAQWDIAKRAQELGVQGQPQVDDARAKYEQASADAMGAELDVSAKAAALEQWTGMHEDVVQPVLRDDAYIPDMLGTDLQTWLAQLDARSPALQAAQSALAAADLEIDKQRAGHQPTVDLVATYGNTAQDVGNFRGNPAMRFSNSRLACKPACRSTPAALSLPKSAKPWRCVTRRSMTRNPPVARPFSISRVPTMAGVPATPRQLLHVRQLLRPGRPCRSPPPAADAGSRSRPMC